jgi:hypothetical protein
MAKPEFQNVAVQYNAIIKKLIDAGIALKVEKSKINGPVGMVWYLPTHYVTYLNKDKKKGWNGLGRQIQGSLFEERIIPWS